MFYKSRDYCRDSGCMSQVFLELPDTSEENRVKLLELCKDCEAYKFHQYLKENGFTITKRRMSICDVSDVVFVV